MADFKPGDIVEVVRDSGGDTKKGAIGRINSTGNALHNVEFSNRPTWLVASADLRVIKSSRLFPKRLTTEQAT